MKTSYRTSGILVTFRNTDPAEDRSQESGGSRWKSWEGLSFGKFAVEKNEKGVWKNKLLSRYKIFVCLFKRIEKTY